ncbi:MAG: aspartate aminotransferase family protein [Hyphomicrobium sp.]|jgi:glutamate-1-semialdehyde 2,1-aminomutase|nr:aspartate aminotransferase family protein [Hyphomicrobium sp.]
MSASASAVATERVSALLSRERKLFAERTPRSEMLASETAKHWLNGVPMHWMVDWGTPYPLFVAKAQGITLEDADGHTYVDFCLGDTGAMFGHSPPAVADAIRRQADRGLTTMLPSPDAAVVGELLTKRFGLPFWQVTATASDANRSVIRWARAATGRRKLLVFNGCYHGAVDDTFVALENGKPRNRPGLVGEVRDVTSDTIVIEFNDVSALEAALRTGDVALVLAEPVMTNCGMVLPAPGYHDALRSLTRNYGTLLCIDETHTISSGAGGYTGTHGLEPDFFVMGKPVSGGVPAAIYGWSTTVDGQIKDYMKNRESGYSGIGTTLSGSALQLACMRAVLENILTDDVYSEALPLAEFLERGIDTIIRHHGLPWHVVRVGLRAEIVSAAEHPRNGTEALLFAHSEAEHALHLYCLNRGVVITPFHNMMLVCPQTKLPDVERLLDALDGAMSEISGKLPLRNTATH